MEENNNVYKWSDFKKKLKKQELKNKVKDFGIKVLDTGKKGVEYAEEHKEGLLLIAGAAAGIYKVSNKLGKVVDENRKKVRIYDHSSGQYMTLKRPLKKKEKLEAFERNQAGEKYVDIYRSMGVL